MEQILYSSSEPEIKIDGIFLKISYRQEGLIRKNQTISIENILRIKIRKHKIGIGFWALVLFFFISGSATASDYDANDELIIETSEEPFYFTFYKNLSTKEIEKLKAKLMVNGITVEISSK